MSTPTDPRSKSLKTAPDAPSRAPAQPDGAAPAASVEAFLAAVAAAPKPAAGGRGRLMFALDATMSRQPTWDRAQHLQAEMFDEAARTGGLDVSLVYFRGFGECRASRWVADGATLRDMMARIDCRGGQTQIRKVLAHAVEQAKDRPVAALVLVGDAFEEDIDAVMAVAGELGVRGVRAFLFQEGHDPLTERAFREIARLTGGAWVRFDSSAARDLAALLRAVAAYASGGLTALADLSKRGGAGAQRLLPQLRTERS